MGRSVPWDVLRVGRFKSWTFSDGKFLEWDVSRAGPFVCAPRIHSSLYFGTVHCVQVYAKYSAALNLRNSS